MKKIYGFTNMLPGHGPVERWFSTREARRLALDGMRRRALRAGCLEPSVFISETVGYVIPDDEVNDCDNKEEIRLEDTKETVWIFG